MSTPEHALVKTLELETAHVDAENTLDLAIVYRRHAPDVMRWATRLLGKPQEAADITQEVFCVVQRKLKGFRPQTGQLTTWLFRITENVVRARRRKARLQRWLFGERELPLDVPAAEPLADAQLTAARDTALVYRALDALKEDDRTALVLFELEGLPGDEVARLMGLKTAALWVRLHRARKRFHERLEALDAEARP
jgi:RNA polymerase sigma-70 factor (ECF subfamily)